jgi:alkaline phosphatase D
VISRRRFLAASAGALLLPSYARALTVPRFEADPFSLGVASGSPRTDSVVLWTRLAPKPLEGGGMEPQPVEVRWEVADDEAFSRIVRRGTAIAAPRDAHAVHVEVDGLEPGRRYCYRFLCAAAASPIGRTRTAPSRGKGDERLRLAFASCQQYEQGFFVAHRHLAAEDADLIAFLGDYIYESSWGRDHVRKHGTAEPATLDEYRARYALYKSDADLQKSHAAAPWIVTWDDHEVDNDYANDRSEELDPQFLRRRAAAYQAFVEHMPVRRSVRLEGGGVRLYDRHAWGELASLHVLDDRQYRSHQSCPKPGRGGGNVVGAACAERLDAARTMLGETQERWLDDGLAGSKARWNLIVQQTLLAPAGRVNDKGNLVHWTDGWDGYPAARARLLGSIANRKPGNPLVIGGDVHASYFANLHADPARPESPRIATELCGTSITSQGPAAATLNGIVASNPHIVFADGAARGYVVLDIGRDATEAKLRVVETVKRPDAAIATLFTGVIAGGRAGLERK